MPRDRERWLRQMAQMLTRIHALALDGKPFESWLDQENPIGARIAADKMFTFELGG